MTFSKIFHNLSICNYVLVPFSNDIFAENSWNIKSVNLIRTKDTHNVLVIKYFTLIHESALYTIYSGK
jgi:hypothetical protein